jgi:outer membrane protein assembly factor BamB
MRKVAWVGALVLGIGWAAAPRAEAVITRLTPMREVLESQFIVTLKVDSLHPDRPAAVFVVDEDLKGKAPFRRLAVNLKGDSEAEKEKHTPQLLKRLAPRLPLVLFVNRRGNRFTAFAYSNGTWFQVVGQKSDGDEAIRWSFTHCEPYLRRTFKGTTAEMRQVVIDGLAGKKQPPEPDPREPPGLGPEVKEEECQAQGRYPALGVIPSVLVGGPIAILALLFPTLFGGVLLLFRRWQAFFGVAATNSTIYLMHGWYAGKLRETWWGTQTALWLMMTLITLLGTFWASRRHPTDEAEKLAPRTEAVLLALLSAICLAGVVWYWLHPPPHRDTTRDLLLVLALGVWAGAVYKLGRALLRPSRPAVPIESVMLWVALAAFIGFTAARPGASSATANPDAAGAGRPVARLEEADTWMRLFNEQGGGMIVSAPLVDGNRIYVAVAHQKGAEYFGALYCLNRFTQEVLWSFDNDGDMQPVFSSPRLADGRLYIGEGFHNSIDCRLYCLDARTGKLCWPPFATRGQVESSPCIHGGKVFFGGGNDGLYAADAATGKKLWQFPENPDTLPLLRVCAPAAVAAGRVFVGSGVDRNRPGDCARAVFALDEATGKQLWRVPVNLPCWAEPVVLGERVLFALGNGDVFSDATDEKPGGAILCLEAATGREVWRYDVPNGVLEKPAVDAHRVYFGARDGHCYCLALADGAELWKQSLGMPIVASVALDSCPGDCGRVNSVYAITSAGRVNCLDPYTGQLHWSYRGLEQNEAVVCAAPTILVHQRPGGDRRYIYLGAGLQNGAVPALFCLKDFLPDR